MVLPVSPPATTVYEVTLLLGHLGVRHPRDTTRILAALPRTGRIAPIIRHAFSLVEDADEIDSHDGNVGEGV
jgi:hypothetical protein